MGNQCAACMSNAEEKKLELNDQIETRKKVSFIENTNNVKAVRSDPNVSNEISINQQSQLLQNTTELKIK